MSSKKLINSASTCVEDAIQGFLYSNPDVKRIVNSNVLVRKDIAHYRLSHVTLISGGGSGHEPAHSGFIGDGMLSAAVPGHVFASPSVSAILAAIRVCASPLGVLLIVKNYTGDRLNFGMAMEKAKQEGIICKMVIVEDDCALEKGKGITGGRGVAGTLFVHKIAGAASAKGLLLEEVYSIALETSKQIGSMGLALTTCTVPGTAVSTRLSNEKIFELGMGIHGEPGRQQCEIPSENFAKISVKLLIDSIIGDGNDLLPRLNIVSTDEIAVLINNLGGLPIIELYILCKEIYEYLKERNLNIIRIYIGSYMTSLEMSGVSITLFNVKNKVEFLDYHTSVKAWEASKNILTFDNEPLDYKEDNFKKVIKGGRPNSLAIPLCIEICSKIIEIEPKLTEYDNICGDGDCGLTMKNGAMKISKILLENKLIIESDSAILCDSIADAVSLSMGGTSGALFELFFRAAATELALPIYNDTTYDDKQYFVNGLLKGLDAMKLYGGASVGMRTMLDALIPGLEILSNGGSLTEAANAATIGMESTKSMESLAGRSNYVSSITMQGIPDPGAYAIAQAFIVASEFIN